MTHKPLSSAPLFDQAASLADQIRVVRTSLTQNHPHLQTLQITSPRYGEGKSLLAANLAIAYAKMGRRTLIVDTNFAAPALQELFDVREKGSLAAMLNTTSSLRPQPTKYSNLDIVTTGKTTSSMSDRLAHPRFRRIVTDWAQNYDLVIFDSAPLLTSTDAQILATITDVTLLAVCLRVTKKKHLQAAQAQLAAVQATTIGCVAFER